MKNFSGALTESYAKSITTIAHCVSIVRSDNITYRFTSYDKDIVVDGYTYTSSYAFNPTAYTSALGLQIENMEIEGAVDSLGIDDFDILKGLFYGAEVWFFSIDYKNPDGGKDKILYGTVGQIEFTDKTFKMEIRGQSKRYTDLYANYYGKLCRARLGDSKCGVNLNNYKLTGFVTNDYSGINTLNTRYIKIRVAATQTHSTYYLNIHDLIILDINDNIIDTEDIIVVGTTTDFTQGGTYYPPENVIDNNYATKTVYSRPNITYVDYTINYVILDLGKRQDIKTIIIKDSLYSGTYDVDFVEISHSYDNYNWYTIASMLSTTTYRSGNIITIILSPLIGTDVASRYKFISNDIVASGFDDNYFQYGNIKWLDGFNAGLQTEVIYTLRNNGYVELALPMPFDISNGDKFEMTPGCNHLLMGRDGTLGSGHCKTKFNNVINFRGEPYLPNEDVLLSGYIAVQQSRESSEGNETAVFLEPVNE